MKALLTTLAVLVAGAAGAFPPSFEYFGPPLTGIVARGTSAYLSPNLAYNAVGIYSLPAAQFQWKFQGAKIPGATNPLATSFGIYSYLRLQIDHVQPSNAGMYTLVANNADGASTMTNWLQVEPLIVYGLYSQTVQSGTEFVLNSYVDSSLPVTYRWRRFGTNFPSTNSFLTFSNMSAADAGDYSVVASNNYGARTSMVATITLGQCPPLWNYFSYQAHPLLGSDAHLTVSFNYAASNSIRWYFNGAVIAGATNSQIILRDVTTNNSGIYWASATNGFGTSFTDNYVLTVSTQAPINFSYLERVSAYVGDTVPLNSTMLGGPRPVYRWSFQGTGVFSDTNSTLTLSNVTLQQTGDYTVIASNIYGADTQSVSLVVHPRRALDRWAARDATTNEDLYGIIFTNGQFVVVGYEGTILTSTNGTNWVRQNSGTSRDLHGVIYAGGQYVAAGRKGTVLTSPNAINWTSRSAPTTNYLERVTYGNGTYVIVGHANNILTSSNAINWVARSNSLPADTELEGVTFGAGRFIAVGGYYHYVVRLDDGDPHLDYTVASAVLVSSNGVNWTDQGVDVGVHLRNVTFANGTFLAVGNDGRMVHSTNATDWVPHYLYYGYSYPPNLRGTTYGAGHFVVAGNYGAMYSTPIPVEDLQPHPTGVSENLHDVAYGLGKFVAVGNAGTIIQSAVSSPAFAAPRVAGDMFHLTLSDGLETIYTLQSTTDFLTWTNVMTLTNDGVGVSLSPNTNDTRNYYRAASP